MRSSSRIAASERAHSLSLSERILRFSLPRSLFHLPSLSFLCPSRPPIYSYSHRARYARSLRMLIFTFRLHGLIEVTPCGNIAGAMALNRGVGPRSLSLRSSSTDYKLEFPLERARSANLPHANPSSFFPLFPHPSLFSPLRRQANRFAPPVSSFLTHIFLDRRKGHLVPRLSISPKVRERIDRGRRLEGLV